MRDPGPGSQLEVLRALVSHMRAKIDIQLSLCFGVDFEQALQLYKAFYGVFLNHGTFHLLNTTREVGQNRR